MGLRAIRKEGDPVLRKSCRPYTDYNSHLHTLLDDMQETLKEAGGVGLAAPQVGVLRRL
jgi:peptide deformylase